MSFWSGLSYFFMSNREKAELANERLKELQGKIVMARARNPKDFPVNQCLDCDQPGETVRPIDTFTTGATRDIATDKPDYEGFMSPLVMEAYGRYMMFNTELENGQRRASDNWQLGIPQDRYMKSLLRHVHTVWLHHRRFGYMAKETLVWALCGVLFNISGYLHELLKKDSYELNAAEAIERENREERRAAAKRQ